jgi:HAD superfamily hydrolase (TIGR01509 family)
LYYDGLPTREKLKRLSKEKGLSSKFYDQVYSNKQEYTEEFLDKYIKYDENISKIFKNLKKKNLDIAIATNSISKTLNFCIDRLNIKEYLSFSISNEQVKKPKPSPEIYLRCFIELGLSPKEVLIIEDSSHGKISALESGGNLLPLII